MTDLQVRIYTQARMLATDDDLCRIFNLAPAALERHRRIIDRARAEGMVSLRYERMQAAARNTKSKQQ